jgi:hypothetical protein
VGLERTGDRNPFSAINALNYASKIIDLIPKMAVVRGDLRERPSAKFRVTAGVARKYPSQLKVHSFFEIPRSATGCISWFWTP